MNNNNKKNIVRKIPKGYLNVYIEIKRIMLRQNLKKRPLDKRYKNTTDNT